jgi:hypothetical protein
MGKSRCESLLLLAILQDLSADNERLRLSASAAREASARQADELKRLQRENARMSNSLVGQQLYTCVASSTCNSLYHMLVKKQCLCWAVILLNECNPAN